MCIFVRAEDEDVLEFELLSGGVGLRGGKRHEIVNEGREDEIEPGSHGRLRLDEEVWEK